MRRNGAGIVKASHLLFSGRSNRGRAGYPLGAEPLYWRALEIDEKSYGAQHPNVARRLNNLGALLLATNRLQEAEPLMRRALEIDEKSYGLDHPKVATDLNTTWRNY
jgi:hypothetical protein